MAGSRTVAYSVGMIRMIPLLSVLVCTPALAVICKTVDDAGNVTYSDVPAGECQQRVRLPEPSTYAPRPVASQPRASAGPSSFTGYESVEISSPENNGTVRSNEEKVAVALQVVPGLEEEHKVRWVLDGMQINPPADSLSATLSGVRRGTHSLSAQILNARNVVVHQTPTISFTLRKDSVLFNQDDAAGDDGNGGNGNGNGEPTPPSYGSQNFRSDSSAQDAYDSTQRNPNTFANDAAAPDYRGEATPSDFFDNAPAPVSTTPGQTNPAFTPNYNTRP